MRRIWAIAAALLWLAASTFDEGGRRYSGYRCTRNFLWFTLETQEFYDGKRTSTVQ